MHRQHLEELKSTLSIKPPLPMSEILWESAWGKRRKKEKKWSKHHTFWDLPLKQNHCVIVKDIW